MQRVKIGEVFVDSGQMMVGDPCYLNQWVDSQSLDFDKRSGDYSYEGACQETTQGDRAGVLGGGLSAVCATGFGDGRYPVYVEYSDEGDWGTRVKSITVEFIEDEDEDYDPFSFLDEEDEDEKGDVND